MKTEFREENLKSWEILLKSIFNGTITKSFVWHERGDIVNILRKIGNDPQLNHLFFPTGGGHDLMGAGTSIEKDCIELNFSKRSAHIIKPTGLYFESFGKEYEWAYFRIETQTLEPSGVYKNLHSQDEELTEIAPGEYLNRACWDEGISGHDENGARIPLPDSARLIVRCFTGAFVIFAKGSIYNATSSTYDARHAKMNPQEFRKHIEGAIIQCS